MSAPKANQTAEKYSLHISDAELRPPERIHSRKRKVEKDVLFPVFNISISRFRTTRFLYQVPTAQNVYSKDEGQLGPGETSFLCL